MKAKAISQLLVAAAVLVLPAAVLAHGQNSQLSVSTPVNLTILDSATIGLRSVGQRQTNVEARNSYGQSFSTGEIEYRLRDSRGESAFRDLSALNEALIKSERNGEREVDVTLVF